MSCFLFRVLGGALGVLGPTFLGGVLLFRAVVLGVVVVTVVIVIVATIVLIVSRTAMAGQRGDFGQELERVKSFAARRGHISCDFLEELHFTEKRAARVGAGSSIAIATVGIVQRRVARAIIGVVGRVVVIVSAIVSAIVFVPVVVVRMMPGHAQCGER